jgi:transcription-repair coupling factor (superfamily II helicase)
VETTTLFRVIALKKDLAELGIKKLEQGRESLVLSFDDTTPLLPEMLMDYLQKYASGKNRKNLKFTPDGRLVQKVKLSSIEHIFDTISTTLEELGKLVLTTT